MSCATLCDKNSIIIVGAGISGLTVGYYLKRAGHRVLIIEPRKTPGGQIRSVQKESHLLEVGPNTVLGKPDIMSLIEDLDLVGEIVYPSNKAKDRFILSEDLELLPLPCKPSDIFFNKLLPITSALRASAEIFVLHNSNDDESVKSFFTRRFGSHIESTFVGPFVSGIWAGDSDSISVRSAFPSIWESEIQGKSILFNKLFSSKKREKKPQLISFDGGLQTLIDKLVSQFNSSELLLGTSCSQISLARDGVFATAVYKNNQFQVRGKGVVVTCDAETSSDLLQSISPELSKQICKIPHAPVGVLHLLYDKKDIEQSLSGFGFLSPTSLDLPVMGAVFNSSLFPHVTTPDKVLLTCFCGGMLNPSFANIDDLSIARQCIECVSKIIRAKQSPQVLQKKYWRRGIPNYPIGHYQLDGLIEELPSSVRILASWHKGIGVPDRVAEAKKISESFDV